jgi:hypothetical protein
MSILDRRITKSGKARAAALGVVAFGAGSLGAVALSDSAQAIPAPAKSCVVNLQTNTPAQGWKASGSQVTVNNGPAGRYVVVNFNSDAGVTPNAEIRVGYRVDAGAIQTPGAQNFANYTQYWQTRHSMVVLYVPAGTHTIRPYWRISGNPTTSGVLNGRCLTAEAYTQ